MWTDELFLKKKANHCTVAFAGAAGGILCMKKTQRWER